MSIHITYGPINITLEQDAEGFAFSCPFCHSMFFSTGELENCRALVQEHLQQFHKIILSDAQVSNDGIEPTKVKSQKATQLDN